MPYLGFRVQLVGISVRIERRIPANTRGKIGPPRCECRLASALTIRRILRVRNREAVRLPEAVQAARNEVWVISDVREDETQLSSSGLEIWPMYWRCFPTIATGDRRNGAPFRRSNVRRREEATKRTPSTPSASDDGDVEAAKRSHRDREPVDYRISGQVGAILRARRLLRIDKEVHLDAPANQLPQRRSAVLLGACSRNLCEPRPTKSEGGKFPPSGSCR